MSKWYKNEGRNDDVVLFSRVRLMRNFADIPFPCRMNDEQQKLVIKRAHATIKNSPMASELDLVNATAELCERGLISRNMLKKESGYLMLSKDEDISIPLCDENHIEIRCFASGQNLEDAYSRANEIDDLFINAYKIAYSDKLGFLTTSPADLGTGMSASLVLHLQGLSTCGSIQRLSTMLGRLGVRLEELYPNGTGAFYVLSNRITLGITEEGAIDNLNAICNQIINQERKAREELSKNPEVEDKIYRTLGILKLARRLSTEELFNSASLIRLGISLGYFDFGYALIDDMLYNMQDLCIAAKSGCDMSEIDERRAELVREALGSKESDSSEAK